MILLFCGPSGAGKSTLCKYLHTTHGIPFIETSSKPLWDKYSITSHQDIILRSTQDKKWGMKFQNELLDYREKLYNKYETFCSDRSPLDNAAYFLLQNSPWASQKETGDYLERCFTLAHKADRIVKIGSFGKQVPHDGMRIDNQYYQDMFNQIMRKVIHDYGNPNIYHLNVKGLPARKEALTMLIESLSKPGRRTILI